jgi:hypothetical protein
MSEDALGRRPIADAIKAQIDAAFQSVPEGKRGALLVLATEDGVTAHVAAKLGDHWKVAAGCGTTWQGKVNGSVAIMGAW